MRKLLTTLFNLPPKVGEGSGEGFKEVILKICLELRMASLFLLLFLILLGGIIVFLEPRMIEAEALDKAIFLKNQELSQKKKLLESLRQKQDEALYLPVALVSALELSNESFKENIFKKEALKQIQALQKNMGKKALLNIKKNIKNPVIKTIPGFALSKEAEALSSRSFSCHPFELTFQGSYADFAQLLNQVVQAEKLIVIDKVAIVPALKKSDKKLKMQLNLSIYFPLSITTLASED